ncbi:MAG: bifunctional demethylmenaquinone methyltransferase/2-methoxy-6-polyprenyl-1,4-benzoquinol methylase UbiE [Methylotenera sp.]|nr:bifunctional demethylmenaquinone methyltransferase/2-methoxy-6-polyprenyl-1,4-benzoquinol methylase UbiE [Methylotenera sp.]MDO9233282.1 bifunctional demethylmenaquinone methyltransferase/2-methoxy-6-polyprenyl-1,4-benzoquinol methylase UbiE [Methylotenera sp.]MDO9388190.1 bifunctional demethylmenaquinone methyltransferase/2-methoxy-6-polyprenyl-1,4-benzoquinol methylase UbiE [Methylotenera sp.]MDP1596151.1 bifunctional demethylmenaquinone methyltransferase/2-methoxy-6-polyprenyl-1,4-benzoqui
MTTEQNTHFGYKTVAEAEKAKKVAEVFHSVASKYDLMNDVMSAGLHRSWKRFAVGVSGVSAGDKVLDIAGGSGDLSKLFAKEVGSTGQVILTDINASMLGVGRDRMLDAGLNVPALQCDAEKLPFPDQYFDCVIVAFGLRNMTHKDRALAEMQRVLKVGGRLLVLEFSKVWQPLAKAYDAYSFKLLPLMGKLLAKDAESYQYLAESIRMHPDQEALKQMMMEAGLSKVDYYNLAAGVVALHKGYKT